MSKSYLDGRVTFNCPFCEDKTMVYTTKWITETARERRYICQSCSSVTVTLETISHAQAPVILESPTH